MRKANGQFEKGHHWREARPFREKDWLVENYIALRRDDSPDMPFHIHHVVSFADKELRAEPSNLVLLCEACHQFVHSRENLTREYLPQEPDTPAPA